MKSAYVIPSGPGDEELLFLYTMSLMSLGRIGERLKGVARPLVGINGNQLRESVINGCVTLYLFG